jgi:hypothetical protein
MQKALIHYSDLQLLHDFFCSNDSLSIYDPDHRLLNSPKDQVFSDKASFNLSSNGSGHSNNMKLYFGSCEWNNSKRFYYINNPDGTIRWLFPADMKKTAHMALYNASSWKAKIYKSASAVLFAAGKSQWLASGSVCIDADAVKAIEEQYEINAGEEYALFMGTRGQTRKIVAAVHKGNKITHFIKIPVSDQSEQLILNEIKMLKELSKYDFTTLSIPHVSDGRVKAFARLSNVKPAVTISADRIKELHIKTLSELYATSNERKEISSCAAWTSIKNNLQWMQSEHELDNGLDEIKTRRIIHLLRKHFNSIPQDILIPLSVSHGDFTPWNMYCDINRLYVYDWELSSNGIPMLFDLYHFIFQSEALIHRNNYVAIKHNIHDALHMDSVKRISSRYHIDTELHYRLYLLFTISYYLRLYMTEKELLTQSYWMIDTWLDALEDYKQL